MAIIVTKTEVLTNLKPGLNRKLQIGGREPRYLLELILCTIDIINGISSEPVQFIQLLGLLMYAIGGRKDKGRTDDTGVL